MDSCQHCGHATTHPEQSLSHSQLRGDEHRVEACAQVLLDAARKAGFWVSPDLRVGLRDAATLLGMTHGHLRNLVSQGKGPVIYRLGGAGHRVTTHLLDLAEWRESRRR